MKKICFLWFLFVSGCAVAPKPTKQEPHPRVMQISQTLSEGVLSGTTFQANVQLSGKPNKVVLSINRMFYRSYFPEEVVSDGATITWRDDTLHVSAVLDEEGKHALKKFPAHIILFHRRKDLDKMVLGEWWIFGKKLYTTWPRHRIRPHLAVQSCEQYINIP